MSKLIKISIMQDGDIVDTFAPGRRCTNMQQALLEAWNWVYSSAVGEGMVAQNFTFSFGDNEDATAIVGEDDVFQLIGEWK